PSIGSDVHSVTNFATVCCGTFNSEPDHLGPSRSPVVDYLPCACTTMRTHFEATRLFEMRYVESLSGLARTGFVNSFKYSEKTNSRFRLKPVLSLNMPISSKLRASELADWCVTSSHCAI